jgi:ribosome-associated toxin RatA of RatAB toxin-antitoxin module
MKQVKKSVLLWYSPREMYDLVVAVQDYPRFLPWCSKAEVLEEDAKGMQARLTMAFLGASQAFTTRNEHVPGESVLMHLVDGPFSLLEGTWKFSKVGKAGDETRACKIDFDLRYTFSNAAFEAVLSPVFDRVASTLVDSFVKRAEEVYGAR